MEQNVKELIEKNPWYLWVMSYGMTHGALILALHRGEFSSRIELHSIGSTYFKGNLEGGPYQLRVEQTPTKHGSTFAIHDADNSLQFDFIDMKIGKVLNRG